MKTLSTLLFALLVVHTLKAQVTEFPAEKKSAIVDNLTMGIKSENTGLHTSSALVMFDLINESYLQSSNASKAMILLLKLLKEGKTDEERIAAAVALYKLGNPIGICQLRGVGVFDDTGMQDLFAGEVERHQRRHVGAHPAPDADENPSEDVRIRLRPNT